MNLLKSLIDSTGLSAAKFAEKVGAKPQQITKNCRDGGDMKFSTFKKYCEIFQIKNLEIKHGNYTIIIKLN